MAVIPQGWCFGWKGKLPLEGAGQDPPAVASGVLIDTDPPGSPGRGQLLEGLEEDGNCRAGAAFPLLQHLTLPARLGKGGTQTDLNLGDPHPLGDDSPVPVVSSVRGFDGIAGHVPVTHQLGSLPTSWRLRGSQSWAATFEMGFARGRQVLWSPLLPVLGGEGTGSAAVTIARVTSERCNPMSSLLLRRHGHLCD